MKKLWFGILVTLLVTVFIAPAFAWDFSMMGQFEWRYRYLGRANGYQDLFGDMRLQDNPLINIGFPAGTGPIGFAGPNFWRGYNGNNALPMATSNCGSQLRIVRGGFSYADSDASEYDQRMTFLPEIRINNAIRLRGNVDLAGIRQKYNHRDMQTNGPMDRWYQDRMSQNAFDTAMIPSINQWYATAQLPWGILAVGNRDAPWGVGAVWNNRVQQDAILMLLPYGPFLFGAQFWLEHNPDGFGAFRPYGSLGTVLDPPADHTGPAPNTVVNLDNGEHPTAAWSLLMVYRSGPIDCGAGFLHELLHSNNANLLGATGLTGFRPVYYNPLSPYPNELYGFGGVDLAVLMEFAYLKYNNGRFFANLEYWWANEDTYFLGYGQTLRPGSTASGAPQAYTEGSMFFGELGAMCGPAKLSGMFAWSGGASLNNGNPTKVYTGIAIDGQATDAYNYLLFHTYGGGNDAPWNTGLSFVNDENGMMVDAYALGARLDYAVAANLNIWGSYMWASRVEQNGWLAGQKDSNGNPATDPVTGGLLPWTAYDAQQWKINNMPGAGGAMNPYVDDRLLGWEANVGVDWKLLENMTVMSRYAYWQPGPWFDQAYQVIGLNGGGGASVTGFMQGRSAIQAFSSSIMIDF